MIRIIIIIRKRIKELLIIKIIIIIVELLKMRTDLALQIHYTTLAKVKLFQVYIYTSSKLSYHFF